MIKARYDKKYNAVVIEFIGRIDAAQAKQSYLDIQKIVSAYRKGFKILTDFSLVESMDLKIKETIAKSMDFLDKKGVKEIIRVIPDPAQDIGFSIMSLFHYSKKVKFLTFPSRKDAETYLFETARSAS